MGELVLTGERAGMAGGRENPLSERSRDWLFLQTRIIFFFFLMLIIATVTRIMLCRNRGYSLLTLV